MPNHNRIRIGLAANALFEQIIKTDIPPVRTDGGLIPLGAGVFHDSLSTSALPHLFIAFDNAHGHCWTEEFSNINAAFNWIKNGSEGEEQAEPKQAVVEEAHPVDDNLEPFGIVDDSIVILLAAAGTALLVSAVLYLIGA